MALGEKEKRLNDTNLRERSQVQKFQPRAAAVHTGMPPDDYSAPPGLSYSYSASPRTGTGTVKVTQVCEAQGR